MKRLYLALLLALLPVRGDVVFSSGSSQYAYTTALDFTHTNYPWTLAIWVEPTTLTANQSFLSLGSGTIQRMMLDFNITAGATNFGARSVRENNNSVIAGLAYSNAPITPGQKFHIAGFYRDNNYRVLYINGTAVSTNTDLGTVTNAALDRIVIGARFSSSYGLFANAELSEAAIWNRELTAEEHANLGNTNLSFAPSFYLDSLVFYAPLWDALSIWCYNVVGNPLTFTNSPSTGSDHPKVVRPAN